MDRFKKFLSTRHGVDQLAVFLLVIAFICSLLSSILPFWWTHLFFLLVSLIAVGWCYFRIFSTKREKRQKENQLFLQWWLPKQNWLIRKKNYLKECGTYRHFKCPQCKQMLRVPKGKGALRITCPKCKATFPKKT